MAMNPMGGIDQQIQQRKMQFKDNPQQLQQRYGQNKQLLDLLALQEISKEQQQRSQRMQMEAQQNPATVADQMQQEVLQGKKAEMSQGLQGIKGLRERTKDVGGALAQKQQQQQRRMQQQGQQPQRPLQQQQRPQGQPMMAAAGGLMTQAAPNIDPRYFEGGGIVAFSGEEGSYIPTQEEIEAERNRNPRMRGFSDDRIREILTRRSSMLSFDAESMQETGRQDPRVAGYRSAAGLDKVSEEVVGGISDAENAGIDAELARRSSQSRQEDLSARADEELQMLRAAPEEDAVALAVGEEVGTAAADETELSTLEQAMEQAKQFGPSGAPAAPRSTGSISPEFSMTPEENANQQQQAQGNRLRQGLAVNAEEALGAGGGAEGLEALNQGQLFNSARLPPEGIRRPEPAAPAAPEKQLTPQQQYLKLLQAQEEAINKKEEGLKDTRSNTRRLLDRLTDAAINASKRPAATTSRGALASFGTGISESVRAEKAERKEGLADIAKRRGELVDRQLAGQLGLAQISQGQQGLDIRGRAADTAEATLAESTRRFDETLASTEGRFDRQLATSEQQWKGSNALAVLEAQGKIIGQQATLDLKEAELDALTAFQNAKTNIGNQDLQIKAQKAMGDYEADVLKLQQEALTALGLDSRYTGDANKALRDKQAEIIKLQFAGLIANKRKDLSSILGGGSGAVDFGSLR